MAIGWVHTHRAMSGRLPETIPGGHRPGAQPHRGGVGATYTYPYRRELSPLQGVTLALISTVPRDLKEASDALGIGEWSRCRQALDQLVNRGLAEEIHGYPTTWAAL